MRLHQSSKKIAEGRLLSNPSPNLDQQSEASDNSWKTRFLWEEDGAEEVRSGFALRSKLLGQHAERSRFENNGDSVDIVGLKTESIVEKNFQRVNDFEPISYF